MRKLPTCHHFYRCGADLLCVRAWLSSQCQCHSLCAMPSGHIPGQQWHLLALRCRPILAISKRDNLHRESYWRVQHRRSHRLRFVFCWHVLEFDKPNLSSLSAGHHFHRRSSGMYSVPLWVAGKCQCHRLRAVSCRYLSGGQWHLLALRCWSVLTINQRHVLPCKPNGSIQHDGSHWLRVLRRRDLSQRYAAGMPSMWCRHLLRRIRHFLHELPFRLLQQREQHGMHALCCRHVPELHS